jgi:hypothetical protein
MCRVRHPPSAITSPIAPPSTEVTSPKPTIKRLLMRGRRPGPALLEDEVVANPDQCRQRAENREDHADHR